MPAAGRCHAACAQWRAASPWVAAGANRLQTTRSCTATHGRRRETNQPRTIAEVDEKRAGRTGSAQALNAAAVCASTAPAAAAPAALPPAAGVG